MKLLVVIIVAIVVGIIAISAAITQYSLDIIKNIDPTVLEKQENLELALSQCNLIIQDDIALLEDATLYDDEVLLAAINWEYCVNNAVTVYGTLNQQENWELEKQQHPLRLEIDAQLKSAQIQECNEQWSNQTQKINECIDNVNLQFP
ncbi:hypothetical protein C6990_07525 [Nitrosopumilus sp. b3]|uniref:hypothetical protein n=1 Tax=Nitrosopumilus sp. b3 TaxID=2109909 RepID=UPI0015F47B48|nr:hypothetical protein [Nitrosopumilus sp. b3]KAF6246931.1 hypothetical protein C6990_07525 [Nitrosopumilus sp. b3]